MTVIVAKFIMLLKLLRVRHWIKNGLVLLPLFFSGNFLTVSGFQQGVYAFLAFSLLASSIYILNDIRDLESDRRHPVKCLRPLPAGIFTVRFAGILSVLLALAAFCIDVMMSFRWLSLLVLLSYWILNISYSLGCKNIPILDIGILAFGFVLRVLYGGVFCRIVISDWLFFCVLTGSLFMAIGKRRNELRQMGAGGGTRAVLKFYPENFLDKNMYLSAALMIVFYSLWSVSPMVAGTSISMTVPFVLLLFLRYSYVIESQQSDGDPVNVIFKDLILMLIAAVLMVLLFALLYGRRFISL